MTGGTIAAVMILAYVVWVFVADLSANRDDDKPREPDNR